MALSDNLQELGIFLKGYDETPRSKMIKKYIPPLQPLVEEYSREHSRVSSFASVVRPDYQLDINHVGKKIPEEEEIISEVDDDLETKDTE